MAVFDSTKRTEDGSFLTCGDTPDMAGDLPKHRWHARVAEGLRGT